MDADFWDSLANTAVAAFKGASRLPIVGAPASNLMGAGAVSAAIPYELGKGVYDGVNTASGVVQDINRNNKFAVPNAPMYDSDRVDNGSIPGRAFESAATLAAMRTPFHVPEGSLGSAGGALTPTAQNGRWMIPAAARNDPEMAALWHANDKSVMPEYPQSSTDIFAPYDSNGNRVLQLPSQLNGGKLDTYVDAYFNHRAGVADHGMFPDIATRPSLADIARTSNPDYFAALAQKSNAQTGHGKADSDFASVFGNNDYQGEPAAINRVLGNSGVTPADLTKGLFGNYDGHPTIELGSGVNSGKVGVVSHRLLTPEGDNLGSMSREFNPDDKSVYHEYFEMNDEHQGKDYGKDLLASQAQLYDKLGYDKIKLLANIGVGGYAWARYGFSPDQTEWRRLAQDIGPRLNSVQNQISPETFDAAKALLNSRDPDSIHALASLRDPVMSKSMHTEGPAGQIMPPEQTTLGKHMLLNSSWNGNLDLKDPASRARFDAYIKGDK